MSTRKVLHYPDLKLKVVAKPIENIDGALQALIDDMFETMYENYGCGLAATQIDVPLHLVTIDFSRDRSKPIVMINPEIIESSGKHTEEEGCLSFPGIGVPVERAEYVKVKALNRHGKEFTIDGKGDYFSACLQHEIDHLKGRTLADYVSPLKQHFIRKKIEKAKKKAK